MAPVKILLTTALIPFMMLSGKSQDKEDIIVPGMLSAQLTLSPSYMLKSKQAYFYLHGSLEGYVEKNVSIAGDFFYYLGNLSDETPSLQSHHNIFFGANYHFPKHQHDVYIGLQPGISFTKLNPEKYLLDETTLGVNPLISISGGYNFFLNNYLHFFIQSRFITGKHHNNIRQNLNELRLSAGLGFNFPVKRR